MNTVIWLLYAADVVGSVNFICNAAIVIGLIGVFVSFIASGIQEDVSILARFWKVAKWPLLAAALVGTVTPSQTTIYSAAALDAGAQVANTEVGKKALTALETWLDKQAGEKADK